MNEKIDIEPKYLTPFKRFCMTIGELPTSYLETMTYYEMLVWFIKYLSDTVIPAINNNSDALKEVQDLMMELQNYVNNYFENLDVQEEINNKLDTMTADGTIDEILNRILVPYEEQLNARVDEIEQQGNQNEENINIQKGRIDALATLQEGSTTGDAELIDGRVNFNGRVYSSIGNNIRSFGKAMFKDITNTLEKTENSYVNSAFNQNSVTDCDNYKLTTKKGVLYYISCQGKDNGETVTRPQIVFGYNSFYPTDLINGIRNNDIIIKGDGTTIYINNAQSYTNLYIGELNTLHYDELELYYNDITTNERIITEQNKYIDYLGRIFDNTNYKLKHFVPTLGKKYIIVTGCIDDIPLVYQNNGYNIKTPSSPYYSRFEITAKNTNEIYINNANNYQNIIKIYESKETTIVNTTSNINKTIGITSNAVFCGDSLTYGATYTDASHNYRNYYNYPYYIKKLLNLDSIEEYARSGATATSWWNRFKDNIVSNNSIYFVWLGTNSAFTDTVDTDCAGNDYTQYADTEVGYFGKILGKISSLDGNKIILLNNFVTGGGNVNTNNKVINDLATKFNAIVVDIKNSDAYTNHDYHTQNGYYNAVHFNSVGNQYIANLVNNKIQEKMNKDPMKFNMYKIHN